MQIEIQSKELDIHSGTDRNQRPYQIRRQFGYAHLPGMAYPVQIKVQLDDNQQPYELGNYELCESSFYVGRYSDLAISRIIRLKPIAASK